MGKTGKKLVLITAGAIAAWAAAIKPRTKGKPDMRVFSSYDYANGGIHNNCKNIPENTLQSYKNALQHGYGIAIDVRLTSDGIPVAFSDHDLWRMCSVEGNVEDLTLEELKQLTLLETSDSIPSLKEALDYIDGQVPVLIQLKSEEEDYSQLCEKTAVLLDQYDGICAVEALDYRCVRWFMRYRPFIIRGQMLEKTIDLGNSFLEFVKQIAKNCLLTNILTKPDFISSNFADRRSISLSFCRFLYHVPVLNWVIHSHKEYESARLDDAVVIFEDIRP